MLSAQDIEGAHPREERPARHYDNINIHDIQGTSPKKIAGVRAPTYSSNAVHRVQSKPDA